MADFKDRLAQSQAKLDEAKVKFDDAVETAKIAAELKKDELNDKIADAKGDAAAAAESARIAGEKAQGKFNGALLKAQMTLESAKATIAEKKEEHDRVKAENRIFDLLDYADQCRELALNLVVESKLATLEAAAEAIEYEEKYGE